MTENLNTSTNNMALRELAQATPSTSSTPALNAVPPMAKMWNFEYGKDGVRNNATIYIPARFNGEMGGGMAG